MAEEGTAIVGEDGESSLAPSSSVEIKARAKGWKPLGEATDRDGNLLAEEDWVDAKEFVGRQKLFDRIEQLNKELKSQGQKFQQDMSQVSEHFAKMQQVEFDKAMKQLKVEKQIALEDRNLVAVEAINDEIKEKEKEFETVQRTTPKPKTNTVAIQQEFDEWKGNNGWFESDKELQREAIAIGTGYAVSNPNLQQSDVLEYVESRIKKIYPEKFEQKKAQMNNQVEAGGITANSGTNPGRKSKGLTAKDLDEREYKVMQTLIKTNALKAKADKNKISQEQQYLNDLTEARSR